MSSTRSQNAGVQLAAMLRREIEKELDMQIQVILFGSYARGEASDESDIDVLVVLEDIDKHSLDTVLEVAWQVGFEAGKVISVIPATHSEMNTLSTSPFFQVVRREGVPA